VDCLGDVDSVIDCIEHRDALRKALAGLPDRERNIIVRSYSAGWAAGGSQAPVVKSWVRTS
jgi:hypothetical protein